MSAESRCTCTVDPKYWTTQHGAIEPGSMMEWDPGCPEHGWPHSWCATCGCNVPVLESSDEEIGFEERARNVRVTRLDCGHEIVVPA